MKSSRKWKSIRGGRPKNLSHDEISFPRLRDLGIDSNKSSLWQTISAIPEDAFEEFIHTTKSKEKELTSAGALLLAREIQRQRLIADLEKKIEQTPSVPHQTYEVVLIDPPWHYHLRQEQTGRRNTTPYPTMSLDEIKVLPVQTIAAEDAILWLWTTNTHLPDAFDIVREWSFHYKVLLTWVKNRLGTGDWLRGRTEHCLMAVRGRPVIKLTNQSTVIHTPVREHSQKPDEFYRLVETLCTDRKSELFARENRVGWDTWLASAEVSRSVGV